MPTYDYRCDKCGETFEVWQSMADDPLRKHPGCGGRVARVFAPVGIAFKGSGFYKNDHGARAGEPAKKEAETAASGASGSAGSSDSAKSPSSGDKKSSGANGSKSSGSGSGDKKPSSSAKSA